MPIFSHPLAEGLVNATRWSGAGAFGRTESGPQADRGAGPEQRSYAVIFDVDVLESASRGCDNAIGDYWVALEEQAAADCCLEIYETASPFFPPETLPGAKSYDDCLADFARAIGGVAAAYDKMSSKCGAEHAQAVGLALTGAGGGECPGVGGS